VQKLKEFCPDSLKSGVAKLRHFLMKNLAWVIPGQGFFIS
jgi:Na+/citrate or Na+/malate symporter